MEAKDTHRESPMLTRCLEALRTREADFHARGVLHAAIFGSVARGEDRAESDVDVIIEVSRGMGFGALRLVRLRDELADLFERPVDVVPISALKSPKHDHILNEMISAF